MIDAACGSSLAAIKMAVEELITGQTDMMITGGVDTDNTIASYMSFSKTPAFTKGEVVKTFDADSGRIGWASAVMMRMASGPWSAISAVRSDSSTISRSAGACESG